MPKCETCGSIAMVAEIEVDKEKDRTSCPKCRRKGRVNDERYEGSVRVTDTGIEVFVKTPQGSVEYADAWSHISRRLSKLRERTRLEQTKKPELALVEEKTTEG